MHSWCDKLASVPSVGLKFEHHFAPSDAIIAAISPILDRMVDGDKLKFTMAQQDTFGVQFTTNEGFNYGIEPSRIFIDFRHRMRAKNVSAGPPVLEMLSRAQPFTLLLPEVSKRLVEFTMMTMPLKQRPLLRIGIVSTTIVAADEAPPGIRRFIEYLAKPWNGLSQQYNIQITATLPKQSGSAAWTDKCVHVLARGGEDTEDLITVKFDWQRTFASGRSINKSSLEDLLKTAEVAALNYFEDVAEGNRFDADLLNTA